MTNGDDTGALAILYPKCPYKGVERPPPTSEAARLVFLVLLLPENRLFGSWQASANG